LRIDHGHAQRSLVEWKFRQLSELHPSPPRRVDVYDRRTQRTYAHYRFDTQTTEVLDEFFELFYGRSGEKRVPREMASYAISALSVAVWYMDDGGRRGDCRSGYLNSQAFSPEDVSILRDCLWMSFGLASSTHFAAGKPRSYIAAAQFERFCDLVRPHVIPDMQYKLL
jgi:hypothetical protein